jgi:3-deoxy-D-manno-octulosonic acid hydroxylase-like protein
MLRDYSDQDLERLVPFEMGDSLERGEIIRFPHNPIPLPSPTDLLLLRDELPKQLNTKNVSYHPESDHVHGVPSRGELHDVAYRFLKAHSLAVEAFLKRSISHLTQNWTVGTSSFRPIQEKGRDLKPHASNELIHVDAGAYGATNGDRILRFFVNVSTNEDRVWATKGTFSQLHAKHALAAGIGGPHNLDRGPLGNLRTKVLRGLVAAGVKEAMVADSSPYDRLMRRFHNYMKDTPAFQARDVDYHELRFAPGSAWMVFTDSASHASISGQHALVNTFIVRLAQCRVAPVAPLNILRTGRAA